MSSSAELAQLMIKNDSTLAVPLIILLHRFLNAHKDIKEEARAREAMLVLYTSTEHCEKSLESLISENESTSTPLAA